ncbi:MAG: hypothetical protein IJ157_11950 [Clostridia bacterium]|nr:hypothetical protein [Clostridia bacterium]
MNALKYSDIRRYAAEAQFSAAYCFAPVPEDGAPENVKTLVLLARAYTPGGRLVDRFYPASNAAYHAAKELAKRMAEDWHIEVLPLSNLKLKPMCRRHPSFGTGMNTLNYLPGIGSRFCMELLGLSAEIAADAEIAFDKKTLPCAECGRCRDICPGGAITEHGFVKEKCIRYYMLSGKPMPEHLRPYIKGGEGAKAIVGCDICQRVCPANAEIEKKRTMEDEFDLRDMLTCSDETLHAFAELYGKNYANRNRIIAQALLAAGNSGDAEYLKEIERLCQSPSALVAEHARWAKMQIEKLRKIY